MEEGKRHLDRPGYAVLSRSAEMSNIQNTNGVLDALYSSKARLASQTREQVSPLYNNRQFYGRSLRAAMSAKDASKK